MAARTLNAGLMTPPGSENPKILTGHPLTVIGAPSYPVCIRPVLAIALFSPSSTSYKNTQYWRLFQKLVFPLAAVVCESRLSAHQAG